MTSARGREVTINDWKKSDILGLLDGYTVLPPEDPFMQWSNCVKT